MWLWTYRNSGTWPTYYLVCRNVKGKSELQLDFLLSIRPYSYFPPLLQPLQASVVAQHLRPQRVREKTVFLKFSSFRKASSFWNYKKLHFPVLVQLHNQRRQEITVLGKNTPGDKSLWYWPPMFIAILIQLILSSFRTPEKESISKAVLQKSRGRSHLWAHSKEPLKQPLLKRACTDSDLRDLACQAFTDILSLFSLGPENTQGKE